MPRRSQIDRLPESVRRDLNEKLLSSAFSGYDDLERWLRAEGYRISRSAIGRYGIAFKARCETLRSATEQAQAIVEASSDEEDAVGQALIRLTQDNLFRLLMASGGELETTDISRLTRAIADITRASTGQRRHLAEVRTRAVTAAEEVDKVVRKSGLSDEAAKEIKAKILGIVD